jgi:membrane protein DedA with SNARE-associated domain
MEAFLEEYGYIALVIGTFLEGETAILVVSTLTGTGMFSFPATILFGFMGSFISDWLYYLIGRLNGKYFIERRPALKAKVLPVTAFFHRHKLQILFAYRFLYGFRVIIPLVIGMSGVRPAQYLGFSVVSGLIWATSVSTVGYYVGRILNVTADTFRENIVLIVVGFALFGIGLGFVVNRLAFRGHETR